MKYTNPCNNHCRFCSVGKKRHDNVPFDAFVRIIDRFGDWVENTKTLESISPGVMHTHALMSYEQSKKFLELCHRFGSNVLPLQMNGCIFMPEDDLYRVMENHYRAGYRSYSQTYAGNREIHDLWVGRRGEFDFLAIMAKVAEQLGYTRKEQLLLSNSSIPVMEELLDHLDLLSGPYQRDIYPFTFIGWAKRQEKERVNRTVLTELSPRARAFTKLDSDDTRETSLSNFKTEGEWITYMRESYDDLLPREKYMLIRLDESNLERFETEDPGEVYQDYFSRFMNVYQKIPEMSELCEMYGDDTNDKLYGLYELERMWADRYVEENLPEFFEDYDLSGF
jgi:hypothetical protein